VRAPSRQQPVGLVLAEERARSFLQLGDALARRRRAARQLELDADQLAAGIAALDQLIGEDLPRPIVVGRRDDVRGERHRTSWKRFARRAISAGGA
jgi:hypothetical protein